MFVWCEDLSEETVNVYYCGMAKVCFSAVLGS